MFYYFDIDFALRSKLETKELPIEMLNIQPFAQHTLEYENWFTANKYVYQSELAAVRHFIPTAKIGVEIGVGSGQFGAPLRISIGIDPSQSMLALAKKRTLTVARAVGESLPFPDNSMDFALMVTSVCFFNDIDSAFAEANRILKPAGRLIIGFVDKDSALGKIYLKKKHENVFYQSATFYSVDEIIACLKRNGFHSFAIIQTVFGDLKSIQHTQQFQSGSGDGGFVVINAER
ncbi:class I SAM-dependent methyltransferase [candidate division KSB1 bacterium]|nr:class I SAM-dependent methyltransferase [candidate division KSB1 bacterium]